MKSLKFLVAVVLLMGLATGVVFAQGTTTTFIQVQNLSGDLATCTITYYNQDGTKALEYGFTINANGIWSKYQGSETGLATGFNGSVVVSCDKPVAAIANQKTDGAVLRSGSYSGSAQGAPQAYVPIAMKTFYGFSTEISVQNAGSGDVNVVVDYYNQAGAVVTAARDTANALKAGAVARFNQANNANLPSSFNGSALVTANGPVVVVINQNGPNKQNTYNGFLDGGQTLFAPIIMNAYYGFKTVIQVQNVGAAQTRVRVTYSDGIVKESDYVQPNSSVSFYNWTEGHAANFNGAATIASLDGQNLVAMINQTNDVQSSSYNAFVGGGTQFILPTILRNYYDYSTSMQIQNVSGGNVDCNVTYNDGVTPNPARPLTAIPSGSSVLIPNRSEAGHGDNYTGSATVVCTGNVVVVVNQGPNAELTQYAGFDASLAYNGIMP